MEKDIMGIIRKIVLFILFAAAGTALAAFPAERAYAGDYAISNGDITINCTSDGQTVTVGTGEPVPDGAPSITGTSNSNKVVITSARDCTAKVRLSGVTIRLYSLTAVKISGAGNVIIEISGNNILRSGDNHAGIEKNNSDSSGFLEICGTGSLTATGGDSGAGIGGGNRQAGSNIVITGGTVTATGRITGAGIGGGYYGAGQDIKIVGGTVTAAGGQGGGAGIGGGFNGVASGITISNDAEVRAAGGSSGRDSDRAGAAIGYGGDGDYMDGQPVDLDISGLYTTGCIRKYPPGSTTDDMIYETASLEGSVIWGTVIPPKTVTFDPNGGNCNTKTAKTVDSNGDQVLASLPEATRNDHTFDGWYTTRDGGDKITTSYVFNGDKTVYAHWIYNPPASSTYTITFDPNGGSVFPTSGTTLTDGKLASLPIPEWDGHTFSGWYTEAYRGTKVTTSTVFTSNDTIHAHWSDAPLAPFAYTITFDPNGGSVFPASGTTLTDGKLASLPTPTLEGYSFTGWFTEKDGGTRVTTSTVFSSNETIHAHWKKNEPAPDPEPEPEPDPKPDPAPVPTPDPAENNLPSEITTVTKDGYQITYAGKIPFPGKSKVTIKNFGENFTVSQGSVTYKVTKIKINKKKKLIQVTGLQLGGTKADKKVVKSIKKATKGKNGLHFGYTPYYVKDTDLVKPKFKKGELKSVKIRINGKLYKAKKTEYGYDKEKKVITFKNPNLAGSFKVS